MFAENLKRLRRERGMSQEELASRLGVVRQTVSKWESGSSFPDANLLVNLAAVFQVSADELLGIKAETRSSSEKTDVRNVQLTERTNLILQVAAILIGGVIILRFVLRLLLILINL